MQQFGRQYPQQRPFKPEFKLADFDRNPEIKYRGVFELYGGEQFRENGLRFRIVIELRTYTDAFLEKKKLLMKKKDQRERVCREWNCTFDQWITNFGELKTLSPSTTKQMGAEAMGVMLLLVAQE